MHKFSMTADRVFAEKDGAVFFDTAAYPVQFCPSADEVVISSKAITFPDLVKGNAYSYARGQISGTDYEGCASYVTLAPQNWGPNVAGEPSPDYELADEVIGTVPGDTDIILVYINATRTNAPDQINGKSIPVMFKEGGWTYCPGGSLLVEYLPPMSRKLAVLLSDELNVDGTKNIILRRKQSVQRRLYSFWEAGNATNTSGWTYGGTAGAYGHIAKHIQSKGPNVGFGFYPRNGSNPCSLTDNSDYATGLTADIRVVPGRASITPDQAVAGAALAFNGLIGASNGSYTTFSISGAPIGVPPKVGHTRHVIIAVSTGRVDDSAGPRNINSASITPAGGSAIAMTRVAHRAFYWDKAGSNDHNFSAAIFIAAVPSDATEAAISITYSTTMKSHLVNCWSAYDLGSASPDDTIESSAYNTNVSISTVAGGFAIAQSAMQSEGTSTGDLFGIENSYTDRQEIASNANFMDAGRGFQSTTGATLSIRHGSAGGGTAYSWVAASFH